MPSMNLEEAVRVLLSVKEILEFGYDVYSEPMKSLQVVTAIDTVCMFIYDFI